MIRQTPVVVWFLVSSYLSVCVSSALPLSTIHNMSMRGGQGEQMIKGEENADESLRQQDQDTGKEVDVFPISSLYHSKGRYRDGWNGTDMSKKDQPLLKPHQQPPTTTVRGIDVDTVKNSNIISASFVLTTNTTAPIAAAKDTNTTSTITTITASARIATTANTSFGTTSITYPVVSSVHPPPSSSSSCSSPACKWLASRHFIAVVCMTMTWLVALIILYWMTRTVKGRLLMDTWSSSCTSDKKDEDENQVLAKGIGYFDGSPGLRRFVLIEDDAGDDDDDEEEEEREEKGEDSGDELSASEFRGVGNKEDMEKGTEEREGKNMSATWKPPRKGTYILQEASKKDVLEVGTYRLQENEEEEVDGKEEVEYILEGATYILQSERVEREAGRKGYGQMGGIEGLYGVVGRESLRGVGYGRVDGLERMYGIMGKGLTEQDRYRRRRGLGLYGILQEKGTGGGRYRNAEGIGGKKREKEDGLLLSVRDLEETLGGKEREEEVKEEDGGEKGKGESEKWRDLKEIAGDKGIDDEGKDAGRKVKERVVGLRGRRNGKGGDDRAEDWGGERGNREAEVTWRKKEGRGARTKLGRGWEERWESSSPAPPKRAASFPMDHFLSSQLSPRKLSLILEEDIY